MVTLAFARGVWLDEIWTLWLARHDESLVALYRDRWSFEPHPPVFYAWVWGLSWLIPVDVPLLRLSNISGMAWLALAAIIARKRGTSRAMLLTYALLVFGSPVVVVYFGEFRSYFLQIGTLAGLVLLLERVHFAPADFSLRRDWSLVAAILLWLLVGAWLHYLNAAFCFTVAGMEALNQLRRRRFRYAALLIAIVALGCLSLLPPLLHYMSLGAISSPMQVSPLKGYVVVAGLMGIAMGGNLAAFLFAALEMRSEYAGARASGTSEWWTGASGFTYAVTILIAALIVALAFTTLNISKSFLVARYVLGFVPLLAGPVAWLASRRFEAPVYWLVPLNATLLAIAAAVAQHGNARWETNIPIIKAEVARCPSTRVIALNPFDLITDQSAIPQASASAAQTLRSIVEGGYSYLGQHNGFRVEFVPSKRGAPIVPQGCPVLVWLESNYFRDRLTANDLLQSANVTTDPAAISGVRIQRSGDHALAFAYPATDARTRPR